MPRQLRIKAEKIEAAYLEPGDLFSMDGPESWDNHIEAQFSLALLVRCKGPLPTDMVDKTVYRVLISGTVQALAGKKVKFKINPHVPPGVQDNDWKG